MSLMNFVEAVEYAESRSVVLPDEYYGKLTGVQKSQAVSIAGLGALEQIKFVIDLVADSLREGKTFTDFQKAVNQSTLDIQLPKHRLDNIFRTNMQVAFNRGRWQQQKQVSSSRPYLTYDAINDSRVRPSHLAFDNVILSRDDTWWKTHYPPCGYRCRCTVISLTETQVNRRGGITATPPETPPDEGWDFNPGEDYGTGVSKGLEEFGVELVSSDPKLGGVIAKAKANIKKAAESALGAVTNLLKPKKL
jgi:SPP1 gp7 family putative phage head morphogenesis protein